MAARIADRALKKQWWHIDDAFDELRGRHFGGIYVFGRSKISLHKISYSINIYSPADRCQK